MVAFRPAAAFRQTGALQFGAVAGILADMIDVDFSELPNSLKIDLSSPGRLRLGVEDIE